MQCEIVCFKWSKLYEIVYIILCVYSNLTLERLLYIKEMVIALIEWIYNIFLVSPKTL